MKKEGSEAAKLSGLLHFPIIQALRRDFPPDDPNAPRSDPLSKGCGAEAVDLRDHHITKLLLTTRASLAGTAPPW